MEKVFILGNPRSGTSLLRLMLNSHPDVAAPPESGFLHWWYQKYNNWSLDSSKSDSTICEYVDDLLSSKKIETWQINRQDMIDQIKLRRPKSYADLGSLVYLHWAEHRMKNPKVIVDKNNYYIHHLDDLLSIWPDAKFIFIIRDGRDVACSYMDVHDLSSTSPYKPKLPFKIDEIAYEWSSNNENIHAFLSALPREKWLMVRYEDMLRNTEEMLVDVCGLLGVPYSEKMLTYYQSNDEPASTMDWKKKTLESPDVSNIGRYKKKLSNADINLFKGVAHRMLTFAGYDTEL